MTVRFNDALDRYLEVVRDARRNILSSAGEVVVIRDLLGRLRLALQEQPKEGVEALKDKLREAAGPFSTNDFLVESEMFAPDAVFRSRDLCQINGISVLEHSVTGAEWGRPPLPNLDPTPPRAVLFGIKGGVGRSTALCVWARHLALLGKRVLVIDLDLESPGVSSTLLPSEATADFGVVDWLVEDAVNAADEELVRLMAARSPLSGGTPGEILVVPCSGGGNNYVAKLSRAYVDVPRVNAGPRSFAERLATMIDSLEREHRPDVVLIDSRAGLHDLAAIAITRLGAMTFLFAVGSRQTWRGYFTLLKNWSRRTGIARDVRERLRVVAAQVPETGRELYMNQLEQDAYDVFADTLYEEASPESPDAFNYDVTATDAPHFPLPIYWSRTFQDWDPLSDTVTEDQIQASFGEFLREATDLVVDPDEE